MKNKLSIPTKEAFDRIIYSLKHDTVDDDLDTIIDNITDISIMACEIRHARLKNITGEY